MFVNPDEIEMSDMKDRTGRPVVLLEKQINGYAIAVCAVGEGRHNLSIYSFYVINKKKPTSRADGSKNPHAITSETITGHASNTSVLPADASVKSTAKKTSGVQYSLQNRTEEELKGIRNFLASTPVAAARGGEFPKEQGSHLEIRVMEYLTQRNQTVVVNPEIGEIHINKQEVKDSIGHGIGRNKAAAFALVPDLLEKGRVVDYQTNWKDRGYDTYVVAAPVKIGDEEFFGLAVVESHKTAPA